MVSMAKRQMEHIFAGQKFTSRIYGCLDERRTRLSPICVFRQNFAYILDFKRASSAVGDVVRALNFLRRALCKQTFFFS